MPKERSLLISQFELWSQKVAQLLYLVIIWVDSSIRFMVDSSIHFKDVPTKSTPLLTLIQLGSDAWDAKSI